MLHSLVTNFKLALEDQDAAARLPLGLIPELVGYMVNKVIPEALRAATHEVSG